MGWPAASIRRSVVTARWRVCSVRCLAAVMMWRVLSARIGCPGAGVFVDLADHAVKVGEDLDVHFREPGLAVVAGDVDQGERAAPLFAQLGRELGSGEEDRAGQAGFSELTV